MKLALTFIVALALVPRTTEAAGTTRARFLMGTVCEVAVRSGHEGGIEAAFAEAARIESLLSTWTATSELARVNRGETQPSPELRALLDVALAWSERTGGAFDPNVGRMVGRQKDCASTCYEEGAFGKGYALDRMLPLLSGDEVMINFGGQILARGALRVSIADPANRQKPVVAFTLRDASLSTSSNSEQSHILDPRTGTLLPRRGSVSVIADDALTADILSTALYVLGEDDGLRWADINHVAAIFIDASHHIRLSATARERVHGLELLDRNFSMKD